MAVKMIKGGKSAKRLRHSEEPELRLPDGKSTPSANLIDYSWLISGRKKIGKTSLTGQFPGALHLMCEPGGKALAIRQVTVRNWREFKGYVALAIKDQATKTVIVDTANYSYSFCMEYVCEKLVIDHPSDEDYGKGWNEVKKEYTSVIAELLHSGKGVVFISHLEDKEIKNRRGETFHKIVSTLPKQAKDVLEGLVDIWAIYDYDGKRRVLILGGSDEVDAGHRVDGRFQYPDGTPIEKIPMGRNPREGYKNLVEAFNNHSAKEGSEGPKKLTLKR